MARNHRLRERRLKLGVSQELVGCVAGFPVCSAQSIVSAVERGNPYPSRARAVRDAIVYLEAKPRREREYERRWAAWAEEIEQLILQPPSIVRAGMIVDYMVDLLFADRTAEYDSLGAILPRAYLDVAGDAYLDQCFPVIPEGS